MESKKLIWLCVDANGDEKISSNPKGCQRFSPSKFHTEDKEEVRKVISYNDTKMEYDHWINSCKPYIWYIDTDYTDVAYFDIIDKDSEDEKIWARCCVIDCSKILD